MEEDREKEHGTVLLIEDDGAVEFSGSKKGAKRCSEEEIELIEVAGEENDTEDSNEENDKEDDLLSVIDKGDFLDVQANVTAESLITDVKNPLLFAIKVAERLHSRANENEFNSAGFTALANRVEDFILRLLDPLNDYDFSREIFTENSQTNVILETAVKLQQKKFFDHPCILDLMKKRWFGHNRPHLASSKLWWLLLHIWCLFDIVVFPVMFLLAFSLEWISKRTGDRLKCLKPSLDRAKRMFDNYRHNFKIPYFVFFRDMLSYLALLGLHFAICVQPSQLKFSSLEWAILVFLFGRLLIEIQQLTGVGWSRSKGWQLKLNALRSYKRDRWNIFDLTVLILYFCAILPLRIVTWTMSESILDNRALDIAGYLYGFNTMLLTIRAFGSILETFEGVGTVQIAFFDIIRDGLVVALHFMAITLAFSSSITKIFVVEASKVKEDPEKHTWWKIASQLGLSLLELSDGLDFFKSADLVSETIVHLLYVAYLVVALILLINLLIALLSNTYQRVQDNSKKEWEFRKAVTILTYCSHDPIPVPLNIISTLAVAIHGLIRKKVPPKDDVDADFQLWREVFGEIFAREYQKTHGNSFPPTSNDKLDLVLKDSVDTRRMVNQILFSSVKRHQSSDQPSLPTGPKAWETHGSIIVEGYMLTSPEEVPNGDRDCVNARYRTAFSPDFPHFEVMTLDCYTAVKIGVAFENYGEDAWFGNEGSVAYVTSSKIIWDNGTINKTKGTRVNRLGDLIRCTIMFEEKEETDGKLQVPVVFTMNGNRITPEGDPPLMKYCLNTPLYPYISFCDNTSVLAKMCEGEDVDFQGSQEIQRASSLDMVKSEISDLKSALTELKSNLAVAVKPEARLEQRATQDMVESDFVGVKSSLAELKSNLAEVKSEVRSELADVKATLNTLLAKLG